MPHLVKCFYCGQTFDRDVEPCVKVTTRRYAHKKCAELGAPAEKTQDQKDLEALEQYIMKLFNEPFVNARVQKQIKEYHEQYHYTYSGMLKSLIYWYEIKGNSISRANGGIAIIPYIYEDSKKYYYTLYLAQISNQNKNIEEYKPKIQTISIPPPKVTKKHHKLFFEEGDGKNS